MDKDRKLLFVGMALVAVGIVSICVGLYKQKDKDGGSFGFAAAGFNIIDKVTHTATTTPTSAVSRYPVQLASTNTDRIYMLIENVSDTDVSIYLKGFSSVATARHAVTPTSGIKLLAAGGSYEILPENMYTGPIFASSTGINKRILITEK